MTQILLCCVCAAAVAVSVLSLHRNAVLGNEVGKLQMVTFTLQKRLDKLETPEKDVQ